MRLLLITIYWLGFLTLNAQHSSDNDINPPQEEYQNMFINGERMPYLKVCANEEDVYKCSNKKFLTFLYENLDHPNVPHDYDGKYGLVMQFYIEKDGSMTFYKIVRNKIGTAYEEAALELFEKMQSASVMRWVAATSFGKKTRVLYSLPIRFEFDNVADANQTQDTIIPDKNARCLSISKPSDPGEEPSKQFVEVDEFPYLSACDQLKRQSERKACTEERISTFIWENLCYPYDSQPVDMDKKVVVVQFIIEKDGTIGRETKILRDIGPGYGRRVKSLIYRMRRDTSMRWTAGKHQGEPVRVVMNLPVYYKDFEHAKQEKRFTPPPPPPPPRIVCEEIFKVVEEMPRFPGCEDLPRVERKACSDEKLKAFIYKHLVYPKAALENKAEGKAVIQFVIEKDGRLTDAKIVKDPGYGMGEAALTAVEEISRQGINWIPGRSRIRAHRILFNIPVEFDLGVDTPVADQ